MIARPLRVAVVAASLRILGGQAVQAQRNLDGFAGGADVAAWLLPINPEFPAWLRSLASVKYVRTVVTQLLYWPLLLRELPRADVVHVFSASYASFLLSPLPAILVARLLGKPVLLNYHSGEAQDHLARSPLARFVLKRLVDLNVVPSEYLRQVFAGFGIDALVVPNSIDGDRFTFRLRTELKPRLLSTRNFETHYNVACTLRAFALVQAAQPAATLTVVGSGSQERALKTLASELGLRRVSFVGAVPPDQMPAYFATADIYVQSPSIDNMPLSVLEAFASGLPVVATCVGGVPAILTDGQHGYLAPDNDHQAIAGHVLDILANPDEARRRAMLARAACAPFDWPEVRAGWLAAYRSIATARLAPVPVGQASPQGPA